MMDLVTLVTACALGAEPKLMHALVWHQSGGEPWAVSVQSEPNPRVYSSMQEAIRETRASFAGSGTVRVGLAALAVDPSKVAPAVFLPCRNVAIVAGQVAKLLTAARRIRASRPTRLSVPSLSIGVRGDGPMLNLLMRLRRPLPRETLPTSTCRKTRPSNSSTLHPRPRLAQTILFPARSLQLRSASAVGQARCSRRSRGRPQANRATVRVTIQLQRKCRHLACPMRSRRQ
jgi:hypothetical protein